MTLHTAAGMVPLIVRARMAAGVAHGVPWGISLDGLLASEIRENTKAAARAAGTDYTPYSPDIVLRTWCRCDPIPGGRCTAGIAAQSSVSRWWTLRRTPCSAP
ncbi:hypothetical protein [Rhodococcus opacus]|uniref:hypothetical protein n=1 Tax=Rhodococcus opacus TaxID=37919 RepID=UPI00352FBD92